MEVVSVAIAFIALIVVFGIGVIALIGLAAIRSQARYRAIADESIAIMRQSIKLQEEGVAIADQALASQKEVIDLLREIRDGRGGATQKQDNVGTQIK